MNSENLSKTYLIETKIVSRFAVAGVPEKKGVKKCGQTAINY
jgi:hypothetical protein